MDEETEASGDVLRGLCCDIAVGAGAEYAFSVDDGSGRGGLGGATGSRRSK